MAKRKSSDQPTDGSTKGNSPADAVTETGIDKSEPETGTPEVSEEPVTTDAGFEAGTDPVADPEALESASAPLEDQPRGVMAEPGETTVEPESDLPLADPDTLTDAALDEGATSDSGQEDGTDTDPTEPEDTALEKEDSDPVDSEGDMPEPNDDPDALAAATAAGVVLPVHEPAPEPEPAPAATAPAPERVVERRGGFFPIFLGGVVAAGLGFAAGSTGLLDSVLPSSVKKDLETNSAQTADAIAALKADLAKQADTLAALQGKLAEPATDGLETVQTSVTDLTQKLSALQTTVGDLSAKIGPLADRITTIEQYPNADAATKAATDTFKAELAQLTDSVKAQQATLDQQVAASQKQLSEVAEAQQAQIEALVNEAKAAEAKAKELEAKAAADAQRAEMRAVVGNIAAALGDGTPYADLVASLKDGGIDVPAALSGPAADGVPTLAQLRASFPDAARDALFAVRTGQKDGTGGIAGFFERQLQVRSVTPRQGDGPDAVLSRVQQAVSAGDLDQALTMIGTLPEPAQDAMKSWESAAQTRLAAVKANESLAQSLNSN
ncbi:COG4223 family protein [Chachezhania sediminis]|uniref:COG4223 family protein n=1 Tax=Chachezhania sediminis TaxID=2599291 RepID=UPI00131A9AC8|nr:hypothetical protein [Chachezhania sediminis]